MPGFLDAIFYISTFDNRMLIKLNYGMQFSFYSIMANAGGRLSSMLVMGYDDEIRTSRTRIYHRSQTKLGFYRILKLQLSYL